MHAYIHNWSLRAFSQAYDQATNNIYVVCVNFIHEWTAEESQQNIRLIYRFVRNV